MARTKNSVRGIEKRTFREVPIVNDSSPLPPSPSTKRPRDEEDEALPNKKARIDDGAPSRLHFVIIETGECVEDTTMDAIKVDADGRDAFEALVQDSHNYDEQEQEDYTSKILEWLAGTRCEEELDVDEEGLFARWSDLAAKYRLTCTQSSPASGKEGWLRNVTGGVFWISKWH